MKLAIVIPRYGEDILGGAETLARGLAERLPTEKFSVEVLTTCANDLATWRNVYRSGLTTVNGIPVRRFHIDHRLRDERRFWDLLGKFMNGCPTTVDEEYEWINHSAHSPALYSYIAEQGRDFDFLIFIPYLYGTTFYGTTLIPDRSIVWPCLHDEVFAHFLQTRLMMETCRGVMFNSEPEMTLAQEKLGIRNPGACVVGGWVDEYRARPERFRDTFDLSSPFVLYAGRLATMKNVLELLWFFVEYKRRRPGPLKLVLIGRGALRIPFHPDVIPLGFLSERDKLDAYAAATVVCQPSLNESFSITVMESWMAGIPVLVNGRCNVTRHHVLRSDGGLCYIGLEEFIGALDWLVSHPHKRKEMGRLGRSYVLAEHSWRTVLERFRHALEIWQSL